MTPQCSTFSFGICALHSRYARLSSRVIFTGFGSLVSRPIGQAFARGSLDHQRRALRILHTESRAIVPAERELFTITLQVLLADAVERAHHATLQDRRTPRPTGCEPCRRPARRRLPVSRNSFDQL